MRIAFDVGANNGADTKRLIDRGYFVHAFEPIDEMANLIEIGCPESNCKVHRCAVMEWIPDVYPIQVDKEADWGCSSLLQFSPDLETTWPGRSDFKVSELRNVRSCRMDDFCRENQIHQVDYLHVDAQGADLGVLRSFGDMLPIVQEGQVEAASCEGWALYVGSPTMSDMVNFLKKWGFKIMSIHPNDQAFNEVNIRFFR